MGFGSNDTNSEKLSKVDSEVLKSENSISSPNPVLELLFVPVVSNSLPKLSFELKAFFESNPLPKLSFELKTFFESKLAKLLFVPKLVSKVVANPK